MPFAASTFQPSSRQSAGQPWAHADPAGPFSRSRTQKSPAEDSEAGNFSIRWWLRGLDLNQRPSGYEPDELPDCSTPRHRAVSLDRKWPIETKKPPLGHVRQRLFETVNGLDRQPPAVMPRGDLLSQCLGTSTIGAAWFHGRVRDGIGWVTGARTTKQ
uniref:Uncharacterized protein n=1 Tax=uncultured Sphingomonadales bacterium HF0500_24B12 TaxID=710993 RepID=E0XYI3_9SPHN|nr:hypothetical protein [uncultured Sphingomonadales bacterium HF0500_24B12]